MDIKTSACTDLGRIKSRNEDSYICRTDFDNQIGIDALLIVADGIGGNAAGKVASNMAVNGILTSLEERAANWSRDTLLEELKKTIEDVNLTIFQAGCNTERVGMGTTCTAIVIAERRLFITHVGDSRAYIYRDGHLDQLTLDHSWIQQEIDKGTITVEEGRDHPYRHLITRAVGPRGTVEVDASTKDLRFDDVVLICTDGLTAMLGNGDILAILSRCPINKVAEELCNEANNRGGLDNTSVVVAGFQTTGVIKTSRHSYQR